jgi:hypothetical protein
MFDPSSSSIEGAHLRRLVDEVRRDFFSRDAMDVGDGYQQVNSARVVTSEVLGQLSIDAQTAIAADLMRAVNETVLQRDADEIFTRADTAQAHITDLICEVVYQELMTDPIVARENKSRETFAD